MNTVRSYTAVRPLWHECSDPYDLVVNSFEEDAKHLRLVPLSRDEPWDTIHDLAKRHDATHVLGIFPVFLQIDAPFATTVRASGIPITCYAEEAAQAGFVLAEQLQVGGVVLRQHIWKKVSGMIAQLAMPSPYFQIILAPGEVPEIQHDRAARVYYEMHIVPGMPGLFQCHVLAGSRTFHPSPHFSWKEEGGALFVTDTRAQRFHDLAFCVDVISAEPGCTCGARLKIELR